MNERQPEIAILTRHGSYVIFYQVSFDAVYTNLHNFKEPWLLAYIISFIYDNSFKKSQIVALKIKHWQNMQAWVGVGLLKWQSQAGVHSFY